MGRDEQLAFLAKHASNFPSTERTETRAPSNANHDLVRAITRGIGGPIKDELDKLRRENETLRSEIATLRAERAADIATMRADVLAYGAAIAETQRELAAVAERFGLPAESLAAVPLKRLS